MSQLLDEIVRAQKRGEARGIASICSAHPWVLKTALRGEAPVLVEATCNQVNQFGGYTGMTPTDFVRFVNGIAAENGLPAEQLILGGDHLGPSPWQDCPMERAMQQAVEMVQAYVRAGFSKIHLDTSMRLKDDDQAHPLDFELVARRTAVLAKAAEAVADRANAPRYIIGTEVPRPGGAIAHGHGVNVTTVEDARRTVEVIHAAFMEAGLESAWERVIAMVVQPGVEFGDDFVLDYIPEKARDLVNCNQTMPFVYEAHSTDYQTRDSLRNLVRDHFAILKVGPALTYAYREAVFSLAMMEDELMPPEKRSNLLNVLEEVMLRQPEHWQNYYHGNETAQRLARKFSLSDRLRYYWANPQVQSAVGRLLQNLGKKPLPLTLVSQYAPGQWERIRSGQIPSSPEAVIFDKVNSVLAGYAFAQE